MKKRIFSFVLSFVLLFSCTTIAFAAEADRDSSVLGTEMVTAETYLAGTGDTVGFTYVSASTKVTLNQSCNMLQIRALSTNGSTSGTGYVAIESGTNFITYDVRYDNVLHTYYLGSSDENVSVSIPAGTYTVTFFANDGNTHKAAILFYHR